MKVGIHQTSSYPLNTRQIKKLFAVIARAMPRLSRREVSLAFVDNATIKRLNRIYRHRNAITDVLSFAEAEGTPVPQSKQYLGEIIIAYPRARQQAGTNKYSVQREIIVLLIHGFLHLVGFDHLRTRDAQKMTRWERRIIREFE